MDIYDHQKEQQKRVKAKKIGGVYVKATIRKKPVRKSKEVPSSEV